MADNITIEQVMEAGYAADAWGVYHRGMSDVLRLLLQMRDSGQLAADAPVLQRARTEAHEVWEQYAAAQNRWEWIKAERIRQMDAASATEAEPPPTP